MGGHLFFSFVCIFGFSIMNINRPSSNRKMHIKEGRCRSKRLAQHLRHKARTQQRFHFYECPSDIWKQLSYVSYFLLSISANLLSSLQDLISRLSFYPSFPAKAPSVKTPLWVLYKPAHRISSTLPFAHSSVNSFTE